MTLHANKSIRLQRRLAQRPLTSAVPRDNRGHVVCAFVLLLVGVLLIAVRAASGQESPFVQVGETVRPAVVSIRTTRAVGEGGVGTAPLQELYRRFFPDGEGEGGRYESPSTGSGFVVDPAGEIITNNHVIAGADEIFVRFGGERREYRAELAGTDPNTDLALLRIDPLDRRLPFLAFGDSDALQVGAWAIAVGNPFGNLESSLTVGVVSAKGRGDLLIGGLTPRYQDFIQTDASINFGNSGGPLVDVAGRVVGVNTAINKEGQGIGFAVPSNLVVRIWEHLRERGRVVRGYLGIETEDLVSIVGEDAGEPAAGARIVRVLPGAPGHAAGLAVDDLVVEFDGDPVLTRRQLQFMIAGTLPGREVGMEVVRDGTSRRVRVVPDEWSEESADAGDAGRDAWLGMEAASLTAPDPRVARLKETLGVTADAGVIVVAVKDGGPAANAGIRPGDVLVSVAEHELADMGDWNRVRALLAHHRDPLPVLVRTGATERYVTLQPERRGVEN
ncbi:MAG: PDZ domain-containing protein [bacterium]|nr:PDZ domain-containing protein [bacterium]